MAIKATIQLTDTPALESITESPFYIPMTGQAARPRRALKHDDTFIVEASLGLEFDAQSGEIRLRNPRLPAFLNEVILRDLRLCDSSVDLRLRRAWRGRIARGDADARPDSGFHGAATLTAMSWRGGRRNPTARPVRRNVSHQVDTNFREVTCVSDKRLRQAFWCGAQ